MLTQTQLEQVIRMYVYRDTYPNPRQVRERCDVVLGDYITSHPPDQRAPVARWIATRMLDLYGERDGRAPGWYL